MNLNLSKFGSTFGLAGRYVGIALALAGTACSASDPGAIDGAVDAERVESHESALSSDTLTAQRPVFAGVWNPSTSGQFLGLSRNYDQFLADYDTWWNKGFRLISFTTNVVNGQVQYSGVWNPSTSGQFVGLGRNYDQFLADYDTWWNKGFRLIAFTTNVVNGQVQYNGVWNPSTSGQFVGLGRNYDQFLADYDTWWNKGFRLIALTTNVVNGAVQYNGVWNPSTSGQYLRLGRTADQFITEQNTRVAGNYRLVALSTYVLNDIVYYNGVWNPGTYAQVLSIGRPEAEFVQDYGTQWTANKRLVALATDHVESLAINRVASSIGSALSNKAVGYAATVAYGSSRARTSGGLRRTATDSPSRSASTSARVNVASVSKTLTATAVLQLLRAKGLTDATKMSTYLPSDWTRGANVANITFGELLSHTSGLRGANGNATSYSDLKTMIANGINLADKVYSYQNQNFALFRVIIPYLNGFSEAGVTNKDTATSQAYINYMNSKVFTPAGISTVSMTPTTTEPTLCYPFPASTVNGTTFGDWFGTGGGAGLQLSTDDLATFLVKLRDGTLLPASWNATMDSGKYGWQNIDTVRHGSVAWHGGYLYFPTASNGNGELNSLVLSFSTGAQIGIEVNSRTDADIWTSAVNAYNNSWVPIQ